jgi:hypothetical protein
MTLVYLVLLKDDAAAIEHATRLKASNKRSFALHVWQ